MRIYVGNLDYKVDVDELSALFAQFGTVSSVKIITDRETKKSKGFGFVEFDNDIAAAMAISELDGSLFRDRKLVVKEGNRN